MFKAFVPFLDYPRIKGALSHEQDRRPLPCEVPKHSPELMGKSMNVHSIFPLM